MMKKLARAMTTAIMSIQRQMVIFKIGSVEVAMLAGTLTLDEALFGQKQAGSLKVKNTD